MLAHRTVLSLLAACAVVAGCSQKPPPSEDKAVLDAFEAALFMPDPDLSVLFLHAAWLGPEAIPPVLKVWPAAATNDVKRIKLARLLEILAWNGFRTPESATLLATLTKDRQPLVRKSAINALFASAADLDHLDKYWDPADSVPGHTVNPPVAFKLPFATCREQLAKRGVAIAKNSDGSISGNPGRTHTAQPPVTQAIAPLRKWWSVESDPPLMIYGAIQAVRAGELSAIDPLVAVLGPVPDGSRSTASLDAARACALRALQELTGQAFTTSEQWVAWWKTNRPKQSAPKQESLEPPPPGRPK